MQMKESCLRVTVLDDESPPAEGGAVIFAPVRWEDVGIAAAAMLAIGIPFVAFTNLVLFHFYVRGSFVLDSGLLASLMWHGDATLTQPASLGGGSFFGTHVSLLFLPVWALRTATRESNPSGRPCPWAIWVRTACAPLSRRVSLAGTKPT